MSLNSGGAAERLPRARATSASVPSQSLPHYVVTSLLRRQRNLRRVKAMGHQIIIPPSGPLPSTCSAQRSPRSSAAFDVRFPLTPLQSALTEIGGGRVQTVNQLQPQTEWRAKLASTKTSQRRPASSHRSRAMGRRFSPHTPRAKSPRFRNELRRG